MEILKSHTERKCTFQERIEMLLRRISFLKQSFIRNTNLILYKQYIHDLSYNDIPDVSQSIIKLILRRHNVPFEDGYTCFIISCPICKLTKSTTKLYINKTTGYYSCAACKNTGNWNLLQLYLSNKKTKLCDIKEQIKRVKEHLAEIQSKTIKLKDMKNTEEILTKFNLPVVNTLCFDHLDVRLDESCSNLYFPLENVSSELVGYRKLNFEKPKSLLPYSDCAGLLTGKTSIKTKETAILVPSIADFLILLNAKISTSNIVCLPNGVTNFSITTLPTLEKYNKLILWLGNNTQSWDTAKNFAKKLGEKRCLFIRPAEKYPLPHLCKKDDIKSILTTAQPIWHKSITSFSSLRDDVLMELQNIDQVQGVKWKRFPALNRILKGHRKGELTVLTGPTGCGKTTLMSEYSLDLAMQGVNTLWGSFEIRNARLARTMLQQMVGCSLENNLNHFDEWADKFELLPIYYMTFHGQQSIKVVMDAVEHAAYVHDIEHVVIDNVQFMMGMDVESKHMDRFWKQDTIIAAFRTFATRKNCHVTLVVHPRKEKIEEELTVSSIFGGAKASQEADNVLIIQDKRLISVRGKKYLQVAKNRYSGDLGVMPLEFDKDALSYVQKKKKSDDKTKDDVPKDVVPK